MTYVYCPVCGSALKYEQHDGQNVPVCQNSSCGFIFWQNSKPCVAVLIPDKQGRVLMTIRGREPDKGKLDLPGGFLQEGEDLVVATKREIKEELSVEIELGDYLGILTDRYGNGGEYTLTIGIKGKITHGIPRAGDDVAEIRWVDPGTVTTDQLAFTNNLEFLKMWQSQPLS